MLAGLRSAASASSLVRHGVGRRAGRTAGCTERQTARRAGAISRPRRRRTAAMAPLNERASCSAALLGGRVSLTRLHLRTVRPAHAAIASAIASASGATTAPLRGASGALGAHEDDARDDRQRGQAGRPQKAVPYAAACALERVRADQRALQHDREHSSADRAADALEHVQLRGGVRKLGPIERGERGGHRRHERKADAHAADEHRDRQPRRSSVCAPISPNGIVARVVTITPNSASGPPPRRSVSLPASGITSAMPSP